jgi:ABC-type glycerol-3-phosphate transport system permease component
MSKLRSIITYLVLIIFGFTMVVPFLWMLATSLMTQSEFNKQETLFIPKEEYHVWNSPEGTKRVLMVTPNGENSVIHVLPPPKWRLYEKSPVSNYQITSRPSKKSPSDSTLPIPSMCHLPV